MSFAPKVLIHMYQFIVSILVAIYNLEYLFSLEGKYSESVNS